MRINEENSRYFVCRKGLRQGDHFPLLFNLVADAYESNQPRFNRKFVTKYMKGGIISLEYADNTLLFLKINIAQPPTLSGC